MEFFSLGIFLSFLLMQFDTKQRPPDYILFEFGGIAIDKAVPMVVFSMKNFDRMEIGFGPAFIINKCEYLSVYDAIKENSNTQKLDTIDVAYYKFWMVRNNKKELFGSATKYAVKNVFDGVVKQIQNKAKKEQVNRMLQDIIRQIQ